MTDSPATTWRARAPRVLLWALLGLLYGASAARALHADVLDRPPSGWTLVRPDLPVQLASLTQAIDAPGWPLDSHNILQTEARGVTRLAVAGTVPVGGRLALQLTDGRHTVGLELSRDGETRTRQQLQRDGRTRSMRCEGRPLPPPGEQVSAQLTVEGGVALLEHGGQTLRCSLPPLGPLQAQLEAGLAQVRIARIEHTGPAGAVVQQSDGLSRLRLGGLAALGALLCGLLGAVLPPAAGVAVLGLGLAPALQATGVETLLEDLRIVAARPHLWVLTAPASLAGLLGLAVAVGAGLRRERPLPRWALGLAGAATGAWGFAAYGVLFGVLATSVGAGIGVLLPVLGARLWPSERDSLGRLVLGGAVLGGALGLGTLALQPRYGMAAALAAEVGALGAVVLWANLRQVRGFNLVSLGAVVLMVGLTNQALRWTAWGDRLVGRSARADGEEEARVSTFSSFEALETTRQWTDYPDQDYPVAPPARRPGALRIVALGGSSTGGAWQNDDLSEFWPAELERRLGPTVQVVNQGVGGWTSFHVRRFLQTRMDDVDPDLVVLYLAHNDAMTPSPVPYAQLFALWSQRDDWRVGLSERLGSVPLYQALRFALLASVVDGETVAVPPEDFAENVDIILALLRERGARLVLAREGVTPDHPILERWEEIMRDRAQAEDVLFVDADAQLRATTGAPVYLDACHLTQRGHGVVAGAVEQALREAGWAP